MPSARCALALAALTAAVAACASGSGRITVRRAAIPVGDTIRTFVLVAPASAPPRAGWPLLLVFHGTGSSGAGMRTLAGLDGTVARGETLVAYPDAAVGNWAEGCDCNRADALGVNDTGFVRALVDTVAGWHPVDRGRVSAAGFSQGALFVQRLACEMTDLVAGVAGVAAPISAPLGARCRPTRAVSVLLIHGTLDDAYPYGGRAQGARTVFGARQTTALWRRLNGCAADGRVRSLPNTTADGTTVLEERWGPCRDGTAVALVTVDGGRHAWSPSRDVETGSLLTTFLLGPRWIE
ncbi:MAG: hypothetical protein OER21_13365 [Gemmatimonadota bacterium]|nr:hypothetical protein [Gemmatimonadota bacterium]